MISNSLSKLLKRPTVEITLETIKKCRRQLSKSKQEISIFVDSRRVSHSQGQRYKTNYTKKQYEYVLAKSNMKDQNDKRTMTMAFIDAYNAIMIIREFFTNQQISYTGSIMSKGKRIVGSFNVSRDEFFQSMGFSTEYKKRTSTVVLKVERQLKDFKTAVEANLSNTKLTEKQENSEKYMDKINIFNQRKRAIYNDFSSIVRKDFFENKKIIGIGGWIFEGFNRMYHLSNLVDLQETQYLYHFIKQEKKYKDFNPGKDRTRETYKAYIKGLMSSIKSDVSYGFQSGDVDKDQIKQGKAEIISGTYLIETLTQLDSIFKDLEDGSIEKAEQGLLNIFTKDPGASDYVSEVEKESYNVAVSSVKENIKNIIDKS